MNVIKKLTKPAAFHKMYCGTFKIQIACFSKGEV